MSETRDSLERAAPAAAEQHDAAIAAVRAELDEAGAERVKLEQNFAGQLESLRQEARAVQEPLEARAAAQVEAAKREAQTEAVEILVEAATHHDVALARVRDEARADRVRSEEQLTALKQEFADRVEAQAAEQSEVRVRDAGAEAMRALAESAEQRDAEARARAQAEERLAEAVQALAVIRKEADLAHAEVKRLHVERTDQSEQARRAQGQHERQLADLKLQLSAILEADPNAKTRSPAKHSVTRRGMVEITRAFVLAGLTGTLVGWYVAFSGILY